MFPTNNPEQKERRKLLRNNLTPAEKIIWKYLRWKQIQNLKFRRQFWVWPYILDFYCHEKGICIEIDGDSHFSQEERRYDDERTLFLEWQWIKAIRYTNAEVYENIEWVIESMIRQSNITPPSLP